MTLTFRILTSVYLGCSVLLLGACMDNATKASEMNSEVSTSTISEQANTIVVLTVSDFSSAIQQNNQSVQLLDVRTPSEFSDGHIEGAVNMDVNSNSFVSAIQTLDPAMPVYVYCRSGGRSARAAKIMEQEGFKTIFDLEGGITAWTAQDMPTKK